MTVEDINQKTVCQIYTMRGQLQLTKYSSIIFINMECAKINVPCENTIYRGTNDHF